MYRVQFYTYGLALEPYFVKGTSGFFGLVKDRNGDNELWSLQIQNRNISIEQMSERRWEIAKSYIFFNILFVVFGLFIVFSIKEKHLN